jgi:hypothetical protein
MFKQKIDIDDIKIFDIDIKYGVTGYNIADLLNMPYYWAGWKQNPHCGDDYYFNIAKNTALNNPTTILGKYYSSRVDQEEKIPNLNRLVNTIDDYIDEKNVKNNKSIRFKKKLP